MTVRATSAMIDLDGSWSIGDKIHGGYLLSKIVRAALADADYPDPLSVSAHFISAPDPGLARIEIETLRSGRRVGSFRARLSQDPGVRAEVLISAGTLPPAGQVRYRSPASTAAELPAPEDCLRASDQTPNGIRVGPAAHFDMRLDPATAGWMHGDPASGGVIRGWLRRTDGGPVDPYWLLIAGDALPPVTFDLGIHGWVPTVTLDAQIRAQPTSGWLVAEQKATLVTGGWLDETCTLWDEAGALVASVRQLASYRE